MMVMELSCAGDCDDTLCKKSDSDGDGVTTCDGDCNDSDPNTGAIDVDGDGAFSCWGDCNDFDAALNLPRLMGMAIQPVIMIVMIMLIR